MARKAGLEWKAVGASLEDLAATMRKAARATPGAIAFANSGVMQQAGVVFAARYITPENYRGEKGNFIAPAGATHGPIKRSNRAPDGTALRNSRGQFIYAAVENKVFIKGKFVSRSGNMRETAKELARTSPTESVGVILAHSVNPRRAGTGEITAGIDKTGNGYLEIDGGYAAAERGSRGRSNGIKGWWRALRSVQGRWGTLLKKKYPELLRVKAAT